MTPEIEVDEFQRHFADLFNGNGKPAIGLGDMEWADTQFTVTSTDVARALHRSKCGKSRGNCAYTLDAIQWHNDDALYDALAKMAEIWLNHGVPAELNAMLYMPLFKGKGSRKDPDGYRGISLIHPLGKLLSMIVLQRLEDDAEALSLRAKCQSGFRKHHQTEDNAILLRSVLQQCKYRKWTATVCFVDLRKAYDTIPRLLLLETFAYKLGIARETVAAMARLYTNITA